MGYPVKIQKVERPTNRSYYVNLPTSLADALAVLKGESFEWWIEDKNTLVLSRVQKHRPRTFRKALRP
jgi:hypothetical protein